jgi:hypothetical protein
MNQWVASQMIPCASLKWQMIHDLLYGSPGAKASCHLACKGSPNDQHCSPGLASLHNYIYEQENAQIRI